MIAMLALRTAYAQFPPMTHMKLFLIPSCVLEHFWPPDRTLCFPPSLFHLFSRKPGSYHFLAAFSPPRFLLHALILYHIGGARSWYSSIVCCCSSNDVYVQGTPAHRAYHYSAVLFRIFLLPVFRHVHAPSFVSIALPLSPRSSSTHPHCTGLAQPHHATSVDLLTLVDVCLAHGSPPLELHDRLLFSRIPLHLHFPAIIFVCTYRRLSPLRVSDVLKKNKANITQCWPGHYGHPTSMSVAPDERLAVVVNQ